MSTVDAIINTSEIKVKPHATITPSLEMNWAINISSILTNTQKSGILGEVKILVQAMRAHKNNTIKSKIREKQDECYTKRS